MSAPRSRTSGSVPSTDSCLDDPERWEITLTVSGLYPVGAEVIAHAMREWAAREWSSYGPVVSVAPFRQVSR